MKQLITFHPNGSVSGLDHKRMGLSLRKLGHAAIERVSDILWDGDAQKWTICFAQGICAGQRAGWWHATRFGITDPAALRLLGIHAGGKPDTVLAFDEYDMAVGAEVLLMQAAIKAGLGDLVITPL